MRSLVCQPSLSRTSRSPREPFTERERVLRNRPCATSVAGERMTASTRARARPGSTKRGLSQCSEKRLAIGTHDRQGEREQPLVAVSIALAEPVDHELVGASEVAKVWEDGR